MSLCRQMAKASCSTDSRRDSPKSQLRQSVTSLQRAPLSKALPHHPRLFTDTAHKDITCFRTNYYPSEHIVHAHHTRMKPVRYQHRGNKPARCAPPLDKRQGSRSRYLGNSPYIRVHAANWCVLLPGMTGKGIFAKGAEGPARLLTLYALIVISSAMLCGVCLSIQFRNFVPLALP